MQLRTCGCGGSGDSSTTPPCSPEPGPAATGWLLSQREELAGVAVLQVVPAHTCGLSTLTHAAQLAGVLQDHSQKDAALFPVDAGARWPAACTAERYANTDSNLFIAVVTSM